MKMFFMLLIALASQSASAALYRGETHIMPAEDAGIATMLVKATLNSDTARKFADNAGFDSVSVSESTAGRVTTTTIQVSGEHVVEGDIGCGTLKAIITQKDTSSPGIGKTEYSAVLDTSGLNPSKVCAIK